MRLLVILVLCMSCADDHPSAIQSAAQRPTVIPTVPSAIPTSPPVILNAAKRSEESKTHNPLTPQSQNPP